MQRILLLLTMVAACYEPPDYRTTHFACKTSPLCPTGMFCSEDHCVLPSSDLVLVEHEPLFLITRDEATQAGYARCAAAARCPELASHDTAEAPSLALSPAAADAYCQYQVMRIPTEEEWQAAGLAGIVRGLGVRCAQTVN
jgi:sulfatase-modifying factor enzyme 1